MILEHLYDKREQLDRGEVLYHKDIGFPDDINLPQGFNPVMELSYGSHARKESMQDKYGEMKLPSRIDVRKGDTIEIGVTGKTVTKMVIRFSYDSERDLIMVIIPSSHFVKTVWFNLKTDQHKTLDRSKYSDPNAKPQQQQRAA
jgi:hypothetical protein